MSFLKHMDNIRDCHVKLDTEIIEYNIFFEYNIF